MVDGLLNVHLGGVASGIEITQGKAFIAAIKNWDDASFQENYGAYDPAVARYLVVKEGDVEVGRGGELDCAEIHGRLVADEGAKLRGNIICSSIALGILDSNTASITLKVDLNDYALPVDTRIEIDGTLKRITNYYADFHKVIKTYVAVENSWCESDSISMAFDPEAEGFGDTSDWRHVFAADLGSIGQVAFSGGTPITIDFGDTLSAFDEGTITLKGMAQGKAVPVVFKEKQERFGLMLEDDGSLFTGFSYNSSIYGYGYEVLWLNEGTGDDVEYLLELPEDYLNGVSENISIQARDDKGQIITGDVIPAEALRNNTLTVNGAESNDLVIAGEEADGRQHTCDLELWVVPEVLPGLDKATTGKFADLLTQAQGNICSISCTWNNIHTSLLGVSLDLTDMSVNFTVSAEREATLKMQGKLEWAISEEKPGTGKNTKLVLDLSMANYIAIRCPWKENAILDVVGSMTCPDFKIGKFGFSKVSVSMDTKSNSWQVSTYVTLPCISYAIGGEIGVADGYWDSMTIGVDKLNVPLGTTGLMLQKVAGSIKDMAASLDMSFGGTLGVTFGPKVDVDFEDWLGIDSGTYSLCEMEVSAKISTAGKIFGSAFLSVLNGTMTGSGKVSAEAGCFSMSGTFGMLNNCITVEGELNAAGGNVMISGTGTMRTPREGVFGFLAGIELTISAEADLEGRYVSAWHESEIFGNRFYVGIRSTFDGDVELLGASGLQLFQNLTRGEPSLTAESGAAVRNQYEVSGDGVTLFNCTVSAGTLDLSLMDGDGTVYTLFDIENGMNDDICVVRELSSDSSVSVAVRNPGAGVWTVSSANETATLSANALLASDFEPVISSVTLGGAGRSAVLNYSLGDISGLEHVRLAVYCDRNGVDARNGICLAQFTPASATGSFEWVMDDGLAGGHYAFYLQAEADNYAPVQSEHTTWHEFADVDTEAPDRVVVSIAERGDASTIISWDVPYDDMGVAGYRFRYGTDKDALQEIQLSTNEYVLQSVPNGIYYYQVAAYDAAGNLAEWQPLQTCLVNLLENSSYDTCSISENLTLSNYESASTITVSGDDVSITVKQGSLIADSTVTDIGIEGIAERMTINGAAQVENGGELHTGTVNGVLSVAENGFAGNVTVHGTMSIANGGCAESILVKSGALLVLEQGADFSDITMEYGSALNMVKAAGYSTEKFLLTDDICTAGTVNLDRNVYGNGYKIYFEEYKQGSEQRKDASGTIRDSIALMNDISKMVGSSFAVVIDSTVLGYYKISDKASLFNGTVTILDKTEKTEIKVGLDDFTLVGDSCCKLYKDDGSLWLMVADSNVTPPDFSVGNMADYDDYGYIGVNLVPVSGETYKLRYAVNAAMTDAVVLDVYPSFFSNSFALEKSELLLGTNYYLQMCRASSNGIWSRWSDTVVLNIPALEAPVITVEGAGKGGATQVIVKSSDCTYAQNYLFRYADNVAMTNAITVEPAGKTNSISIDKNKLTYGGTYYVQVCAIHACESWNQWSDVVSFVYQNTADYADIVVTAEQNQYLTVAPHESADMITVKDGGYCYLNGTAVNVTVDAGGFVRSDEDGKIANITVNDDGTFWLSEGITQNLTVNDGGYVRLMQGTLTDAVIKAGGKIKADHQVRESLVNGTITIQGFFELSTPVLGSNADYVLDIGAHEAEKTQLFISDFYALAGRNTYSLKLDGTPVMGIYSLGWNPYNSQMTFALLDSDGALIGNLDYNGEAILYDGLFYNVVGDDGLACLSIGTEPVKPHSRIADDSMTVEKNTLSWGTNHTGFVLEFFEDDSSMLVDAVESKVSLYNVPGEITGWRVRCDDEDYWTGRMGVTGSSPQEPKVIATVGDYVEDILFARPCGVWTDMYIAQHVGVMGGWKGTNDVVELAGKNRFADVFVGNESDRNTLVLTNDDDGFFLDDIYTGFPNGQQRARFEMINEIIAGDGDDIVDITGLHYTYASDVTMTIRGGDGNDIIWGGPCVNNLYGDAGDDWLVGSENCDYFHGGSGDDVMMGGGGWDFFYFEEDWGNDTIYLCNEGDAVLTFAEGISGTWDENMKKYTWGKNAVQIFCESGYNPTILIQDS